MIKCVDKKYKGSWLPPPQRSLKLNVDGFIFHDQQISGVGVILRDEKGRVLFAVSKKEMAVNGPIEIELLAILRGLQLCIHKRITNLVIESDFLVMVQTIQDNGDSMSLLGNVVKDILVIMRFFYQCHIQHVGRMGNEETHKLANHALNITNLCWEGVFNFLTFLTVIWVDKHCL